MRERTCPACESNEKKDIGEKMGFDLVICKKCGTLYTRQEPKEGEEQDYENYGGYGTENAAPEFVHRRCDELIKPFDSYRKLNTFLDIGFGAGTITQAAIRANWKVSGVEVSESAVTFLKNKYPDAHFYCGYLEEQNLPDNFFDAISIVEVVEHVLDPKPILREAFRILRPGGIIWMTTPNLHGISWKLLGINWSMVCPPDHLELYTLKSAKLLLESAGFRVVKVETHTVNPYEIVNHYKNRNNDFNATERVHSGYELNESLGNSSKGRIIKNSVNKLLNLTKFGDSMKIWAEKPYA